MNTNSTESTGNLATIETQLRAKWVDLLGVEGREIVAHSDFFGLGGNSMLLLALHIFVTREFSASLLIPDLIENAAFGAMVKLISGASSTTI